MDAMTDLASARPLADLMKAPNDGTFYQEPAEEEGEAGEEAAAE